MTVADNGVDLHRPHALCKPGHAKCGPAQKTLRGDVVSTTGPSKALEVAPIEGPGLLAFYRDMNRPVRRTCGACGSGWALGVMYCMSYPLGIGTIITLWKVDAG